MAARSVSSPSGSTDPSPCTYHVFLSFRGADTRTGFTDFLYEALEGAGFHTFRDDNDIRRGKIIEAEIRRGIMESMLSVIVLSKGYAFSEWCLDELMMIMEREGVDGYVVLPVFYDVVPDQVSDQTHCYAEAFVGHKEKFEEDRVEGWRKALRDVANLAGLVLGGSHQAPFVQKVVKTVKKELDSKMLAKRNNMTQKAPKITPEGPGLLVVIVHEGYDLEGKHHTNPYVRILFRGMEKKTECLKNNRYPKWEKDFYFILEETPRSDMLRVDVVSTSRMGLLHAKEESLGYVDIPLSDVVSDIKINKSYHLINSKNGRIQIELQWRAAKKTW